MTLNTVLSEELRSQHARNQDLGCGNFLHVAASVSPYANEQHFWLDRSLKIFTGESYEGLSLSEVKHIVDTYASWYYGAGVRSKDPIAVYVGEGIENLIHFLALNAIGAIPAIVNGNMPPKIAALWMEKVGAVGLYSDPSHSTAISPFVKSNPALKFFVTDESAVEVYNPRLPTIYPFHHDGRDTVLIGHSSGTTGIPKAVQFQHQQFFYGVRYRLALPFAAGSERILSALPHSHSAGLAYLMLAVLNGCSTMILSSNKPSRVLGAIETFKPTMVVAFPETYVLLNDQPLANYDLSSICLWFNGGDAAHEPHIRGLLNAAPNSIFIDGLGSSEMGFSLFRNVHTKNSDNYDRCIGTPLEWVDATVLTDEGVKCPRYMVGRLGVRAPSVTPGYWNDSVLTARSQLAGYFLTGDLFYYDEKGRFFHVDRVPDAIITEKGVVYSLQTEELLLKYFNDLSDCSVVSAKTPEGVTVAVAVVRMKGEATSNGDSLLVAFNDILKKQEKPELAAIEFSQLEDVPLGPTGKVLKRQLRMSRKEGAQLHA